MRGIGSAMPTASRTQHGGLKFEQEIFLIDLKERFQDVGNPRLCHFEAGKRLGQKLPVVKNFPDGCMHYCNSVSIKFQASLKTFLLTRVGEGLEMVRASEKSASCFSLSHKFAQHVRTKAGRRSQAGLGKSSFS